MNDGIVLGPIAGVIAIIVGIPLVMAFVALILRYTSCWNRLENLYKNETVAFERVFGLPVFRIKSPFDPWGSINTFRHVFWIGVAKEGLLFRAIFPLRLIFRPILFPWGEFFVSHQSYIGVKHHELILQNVPEIQIVLSKHTTRQLQQVTESLLIPESIGVIMSSALWPQRSGLEGGIADRNRRLHRRFERRL